MKYFAAVAVFAVAALAVPNKYKADADPQVVPIINNMPNNSCGDGQTVACCNDSETDIGQTSLLDASDLARNLLGGTCATPGVLNILNIANDRDPTCSLSVYCCDNNNIQNNGITVIGSCSNTQVRVL